MQTTTGSTPREEKDTVRIEAFSDGVFAIAITLLVLELKVPPPNDFTDGASLGAALIRQWPSYLAYLISFLTILIMWINHHMLFRYIMRTDQVFLLCNGLLLLCITALPFPTALLSEHLLQPGKTIAAMVFCGTSFMIALAFNLVWYYASRGNRLLASDADQRQVQAITKAYRFGPLLYLIAFGLAIVSVAASIGLVFALAIYFALPGKMLRFGREAESE